MAKSQENGTKILLGLKDYVLIQHLSDTSPPFRDFCYNAGEIPAVLGG